MLKEQARSGRYYGAICASPAVVLHPLGLVRPGGVTCHPGFSHLIDNGNVQDQAVVVDGKCITGKGAGAALAFSLKLVEILFSRDEVEQVRAGLAL